MSIKPEDIYKMAEIWEGLPVLGLRPGSLFDQVGLRYGDIMLRINGVAPNDVKAFSDALTKGLKANRMEVDFIRCGRRQTLVKTGVTDDKPEDFSEEALELLEDEDSLEDE